MMLTVHISNGMWRPPESIRVILLRWNEWMNLAENPPHNRTEKNNNNIINLNAGVRFIIEAMSLWHPRNDQNHFMWWFVCERVKKNLFKLTCNFVFWFKCVSNYNPMLQILYSNSFNIIWKSSHSTFYWCPFQLKSAEANRCAS